MMAAHLTVAGDFDYAAKAGTWNIEGWTDGLQITCGAKTKPSVDVPGYFDIYQQVWRSSTGSLTFWDVTIGTALKPDTEVTVSVDVDDTIHARFPKTTVDRVGKAERGLINFDTEACAFEVGCADRPANALLGVIATQLMDHAKWLTFKVQSSNGEESHRIDVQGFPQARDALKRTAPVLLLGRTIRLLPNADGELRAADGDQPSDPASVERYLAKAFGDHLAEVRTAMEALPARHAPAELNRIGFRLYERFRPEVPPGNEGWGAKAVLEMG